MANGELEPLLDLDEIQGNILGGFNKDYQNFVFLAFPQPAASAVKAWLKGRLASITPLRDVARYRKQFKSRIAAEGKEPANMVTLWQNVAFSFQGLSKLAPDAALFPADSFVSGAAASSPNLGDPAVGPFSAQNWIVGGLGSLPDLIWIIAGDVEADVTAATADLTATATAAGLQLVHIDEGRDLGLFDPALKGHEHFGFRDGISQPGVRGKTSDSDFLEIGRLTPDPDYTIPEYAEQGRPLVCAGEFVIGYARQTPDFPRIASPVDPVGPKPSAATEGIVGPWWSVNGSFLVFRRLQQDVAGFNRFLAAQAAELPASADAEHLGAVIVGRWKSGAPVMRTPLQDNPALGGNDQANNNFLYIGGSVSGAQDPNDGFGPIPNDGGGTICPAAAHVRKVNPRDHDTDQGGANVTLTKRILRRGIPYGVPLAGNATVDDGKDRGLLFLSYQRSISEQFEFLCANWMNSALKPQSGSSVGGFDLLVGQNSADAARMRQCFLPLGAAAAGVPVPTTGVEFTQFVNPTGAGYFFAPSLSAIRNVLAA